MTDHERFNKLIEIINKHTYQKEHNEFLIELNKLKYPENPKPQQIPSCIHGLVTKCEICDKPKCKFKEGDRIATYSRNASGKMRQKGVIRAYDKEHSYIIAGLDSGYSQGFHIKQCRKLRKKDK